MPLTLVNTFNVPACRIYHNANQSIAHNTETSLSFNSERFDTDSMHDLVVNNNRVTFNTTGDYVFAFSGFWANATDYIVVEAVIRLNGTTRIDIDTGTPSTLDHSPTHKLAHSYKFSAGDYVEVRVRQANGAAAARNFLSTGNVSPEFSVSFVGNG